MAKQRWGLTLGALFAVACGGVAQENGGGPNSGSGGSTQACEQAKQDYLQLALQRADSSALSCTTDSDCSDLRVAGCGNDCTYVVIGSASETSILVQLNAFAQANCTACPSAARPCSAESHPVCNSGICEQYHHLGLR